jgi:hypothetical protein
MKKEGTMRKVQGEGGQKREGRENKRQGTGGEEKMKIRKHEGQGKDAKRKIIIKIILF